MKNPVAKFMSRFNRPTVVTNEREDLLDKISLLEMEVAKLTPKPEVKVVKIGDRVKGNDQCGFNRSMSGVVTYVEPNGTTVWVRRDGASSDCFFYEYELDLIKEEEK